MKKPPPAFLMCKNHLRTVLSLLAAAVLNLASLPAGSAEPAVGDSPALTLEAAVKMAQDRDPWLAGNRHLQDAVESMSIAESTLPNPEVFADLTNLPTDSFNFDQERMTQFKVGVSQTFPRGNSLAIRKKQLEITGSQYPYQREDRKAKIAVIVGQLWLDAYKARESIDLIEKNHSLFEQLVDVAEASYSSAVGRTRQQDIVRAQLELTRLEDRLTILNQQLEVFQQRLSEWLSDDFMGRYTDAGRSSVTDRGGMRGGFKALKRSREIPDTGLLHPQLYVSEKAVNSQLLAEYFSGHPSVLALDRRIQAADAGIELARQKYKPEWGMNASYGYREDEPATGKNRPDLFSIGVTVDVPLFRPGRSDREVRSAISAAEAIKTEKWLLLRNMRASFETARARLLGLNQRQKLHQSRLLPEMYAQAEASLTAYTNDDGDFSEVVQARIAELNARINALGIDVDRQKVIAQLNYFFATNISNGGTRLNGNAGMDADRNHPVDEK